MYIRNMDNNVLRDKIHEFYKEKYSKELIEKLFLVRERIKKLSLYPLSEFSSRSQKV